MNLRDQVRYLSERFCAADRHTSAGSQPEPMEEFRQLSVLLVDDNSTNIEVIIGMLREESLYNITVAKMSTGTRYIILKYTDIQRSLIGWAGSIPFGEGTYGRKQAI